MHITKNPNWSASPTPFTKKMMIDKESIGKMVAHHLRLGIDGIFVAGTCGEGPWITDTMFRELLSETVKTSKGRLTISCQVTENSEIKIKEKMKLAADCGADIAVLAPPYFLFNACESRLMQFYREVVNYSPIPVGIYDRGKNGAVQVPESVITDALSNPKVAVLKDSSDDPARMQNALQCLKLNPEIKLLTGAEFKIIDYLKNGFHGATSGGGIFIGRLADLIIKAHLEGKSADAGKYQNIANTLMYIVYGGKQITCWLTGLKYLLVKLGIFSTYDSILKYPLTEECRNSIDKAVEEYHEYLVP